MTAVTIAIGVGEPLVVRVAPYAAAATDREAVIGVHVGDRALAAAMTRAIADAVARAAGERMPTAVRSRAPGDEAITGAVHEAEALVAAQADAPPSPWPTVRARSRKRLASLAAPGAIVVIPVTARNARHLVALIDQARAAGALGLQLVWDGASPPRDAVEHHVFAALEHARATPAAPPVVLAASAAPAAALQLVIAHRAAGARGSPR